MCDSPCPIRHLNVATNTLMRAKLAGTANLRHVYTMQKWTVLSSIDHGKMVLLNNTLLLKALKLVLQLTTSLREQQRISFIAALLCW